MGKPKVRWSITKQASGLVASLVDGEDREVTVEESVSGKSRTRSYQKGEDVHEIIKELKQDILDEL